MLPSATPLQSRRQGARQLRPTPGRTIVGHLTPGGFEIVLRSIACIEIRRGENPMPEKRTIKRARKDARAGRAATTQAGEFVREEIHHVREGKHGARSTKQAIAIGLSKARRAGVKLGPSPSGKTTKATKGRPSAKRSRAISGALKREGRTAASSKSLSRQARSAARTRGRQSLRKAAAKAVRTKGAAGRKRAAQKAARTQEAA